MSIAIYKVLTCDHCTHDETFDANMTDKEVREESNYRNMDGQDLCASCYMHKFHPERAASALERAMARVMKGNV